MGAFSRCCACWHGGILADLDDEEGLQVTTPPAKAVGFCRPLQQRLLRKRTGQCPTLPPDGPVRAKECTIRVTTQRLDPAQASVQEPPLVSSLVKVHRPKAERCDPEGSSV